MSVLTNLRTLVRDSSLDAAQQRFTDDELNYVIDYAIGEVNMWAGTTYVLQDYIDGNVPISHNQLMYLVGKIWSVQMDIQDPKFVKMITQDAQYDPDQTVARFTRMLKLLQDDLSTKLKRLFGLDVGAYVSAPSEYTGMD